MYGEETVSIIEAHDVAAPLFLYVALQDMHAPNAVPQRPSPCPSVSPCRLFDAVNSLSTNFSLFDNFVGSSLTVVAF